MKSILCDFFGLHHPRDSDFVVWHESQYEEALDKLNSQDSECRLVIRNPALFHWFDAPAKKYSWSIIKLDPVIELEKLISRTSLPNIIKNAPEPIVELDLLSKAREMPIESHESAESWIKRVLLGSIWQDNALPDINELFGWLTKNEEQKLHPVTRKLMNQQLELWAQIEEHGIVEILKWLKPDPFGRARIAVWAHMLEKYPSSHVASWFQHDNCWNSLNLISGYEKFFSDIHIQVRLPEGVSVFLRTFLEKEWEKSPLDALSYMTGKLEPEKKFLSQKLQSKIHAGLKLENDIYLEICKFDDFPEAIELAKQLIPAPNPSALPESAPIDKVQLWLRDQYLPYYCSCSLLNSIEKTKPYVKEFENWLKKNYQNQLIDGKGMAYRQTVKLKAKYDSGPVLLYIFDGLDYLTAAETLLPVMKESGAYPVSSVLPYLAFLPSETFITKPTLACGWMNSQLPPERPDASFYRKLVQNSFSLSESDINSATDQDSTLLELFQKPARFYLYLDNQLDREYLHAALTPYVRRKKYRDYLKKQAKEIIEVANVVREQQGAMLTICICSDHGYTDLPQSVSSIEITSPQKIRARSAVVNESVNFEESDDIWVLKPDLFGIQKEMVISTGYGCFGKKPKGATHGSCTPQEISVPWFLFSFQKKDAALTPTIAIEGEIFRRRKNNRLQIIFSNPNEYVISIIEVKVDTVTIVSSFPVQVLPGQVGSIEASFDASSVNSSEVDINMEYFFSHQYGKEKDIVSLRVKTKGAMLNEFDDDFDI